MSKYPNAIKNLIDQFTNLPSIGPKGAERLVFYLLKKPKQTLHDFALAIDHLKDTIKLCEICQNYSEKNPCEICGDTTRQQSIICVVSRPQDLFALEKTTEYKGVYHILGGIVDPLEGITPDQLTIRQLIERIKNQDAKEVIMAFSSDLQGEATMLYLTKAIKQAKTEIRITRLAQGLPSGANLEYADETTLAAALKGRREFL